MKKILAIILVLCCALPVMAKKRQNEEIITPLTQLEKRQFQTKTYPAQDNVVAMKAILNVLQDEGFIVYNVNSLLGYIYGVKDFDTSDPNVDISKEFGMTKSRLNYNGVKVATLEVSINVTQYGEQTRIRANFKRKLFNEYGNAQMIDDIEESEFYDDFYKKVDSAIILQKQIAQKIKKEETPVSVKRTVKPKPPVKKPVPRPEPEVIQTEEKQITPVNQTTEQIKADSVVSEDAKKEETKNIKEISEITKKSEAEETSQKPEATEIKQQQPPKEEIKIMPKEQESILKVPDTNEPDLDMVPDDYGQINAKTPKEEAKELKELVKQAKLEAKQAKKEAKQAQKETMQLQKEMDKEAQLAQKEAEKAEKKEYKEALKAEKEAKKEAKRQAKEMRE